MEILLPPDIEKALVEQARRQGKTPRQFVLDSLRVQLQVSSDPSMEGKETLADFLADYIGVLHSSELKQSGAQMSEATGTQFANGMVDKRHKKRL